MVRTVNEAAYEARRNAILDAAQRAVETRGYEQMALADILGELHISSGAFYHYFASRPELLAALVARLGDQLEARVLPIIHGTTLSALEKLQHFFVTLNQEKLAHRLLVLAYLRVWYADENALLRHKLYLASIKRFTPWLEEIIRQGVTEGVFTTSYPDQTARVIISLFEDLGYATAELLLTEEHKPSDLSRLARTMEASVEALERVLGAKPGSLPRASLAELSAWLAPSSEKQEGQEE